MKTLNILYQIARADFLERVRRYSFLAMLGLVLWLGYASASRQIILRVPPDYVGEANSHWIGALMAMTVTLFLGLFGFYLVKGSVARDYETGVGQIMAATPLTRPLYALGKWLSNFMVLGIMVFILMLVGVVMNLVVGARLDPWALAAPLLIIAMPCMALIAALAVLFETVGWLRGGLGNVIYFLLFTLSIIPTMESRVYHPMLDFAGFRLIGENIARAAKAAYPESGGGFAFSITPGLVPKYFRFDGISWSAEILQYRTLFLPISIGIAMLAALMFDRFNPSRVLPAKRRSELSTEGDSSAGESTPIPDVHLTPLAGARIHYRFGALLVAELKLLLHNLRWWWYAIAVGLIIVQLAIKLDGTRIALAVAWIWHTLILSRSGCRENRHNTYELVFSAPRPLMNQLPALWLAAFLVTALLGSGALLRFLVAGELASLLAWISGALFIPSLAVALGALTGSSKAFEVIYVVWMYVVIQRASAGTTPASPWRLYALLAAALMVTTVLVRHWKMQHR